MERDADGMLSLKDWWDIAAEAREHAEGWRWRADMITPDQVANPADPWVRASSIRDVWAKIYDGILEVLALGGLE